MPTSAILGLRYPNTNLELLSIKGIASRYTYPSHKLATYIRSSQSQITLSPTTMSDFSPLPQFVLGWTVALVLFAVCTLWDDALSLFVASVYVYLTIMSAYTPVSIHPGLFFGTLVYILFKFS
ncbi:hypothetical protein F5Y11DRAFT_179559 [Daldinia sp. FL1419]|nr:hypothetical protein F5Y11DRAFT_179559 [Daldinia sp. FL1419]